MKRWVIRVCAECDEPLETCKCNPADWLPEEPPSREAVVSEDDFFTPCAGCATLRSCAEEGDCLEPKENLAGTA